MSRRPLILALTFAGFLAAVGLQVVWPFLPVGGKLKGAVEPSPAPVWSWANLRSGAAFRAAEKWYDEHAGLRNFWVRLDNEVNYLLFDEALIRKGGTQIIIGKNDWLFERQYLLHASTATKPVDGKVADAVRHMRSVQDKLAKRGIPMLLIIAPSKVEVYPEHVPPSFIGSSHPADVTTFYELYRQTIIDAGINFYDGPQTFLKWKQAGMRNLFARSGTHWSYHAALKVLNDIRDRLNPQMRRPLPPLTLEKETNDDAQLTDQDLLALLNLLGDFGANHPQPYPVLTPQKIVPVEQLPNILWVHDSFGWPLIELVYSANVAQPTESLYYFENFYHVPGGIRQDIDVKTVDWNTYLANRDAVVMVWTEIAFDYLGWGFFEALDKSLP